MMLPIMLEQNVSPNETEHVHESGGLYILVIDIFIVCTMLTLKCTLMFGGLLNYDLNSIVSFTRWATKEPLSEALLYLNQSHKLNTLQSCF